MTSENNVCCKSEDGSDCALAAPHISKNRNPKYEITFPVKLAAERIEPSLLGLANWTLELLMFKHQWLKNSPRGNYLVIRAFWFSAVIPGFILIIFMFANYLANAAQGETCPVASLSEFFDLPNNKNILCFTGFIKIGMPFLATLSIVYWKLWYDYHSKWTYCCGLFNDILKNSDKPIVSEKLRRALSVDLLFLDLWAHRSFAEFFRDCLSAAAENYYKENALLQEITNINSGKLTECDAKELLESHQRSKGTMA